MPVLEGGSKSNNTPNWDRFHDFVIIDWTMEGSPILDEKIDSRQMDEESFFTAKFGGRHYKGAFKALIDAGGRRVGEIVSLVDITSQQTDMVRLVSLIAGLSLVFGCGLLIFFNKYVGEIQNRLAAARRKLRAEIEVRRRREEALAASEKRFRSLFEESKDAIVNTDKNGRFLMVKSQQPGQVQDLPLANR